MKKLRLLIILFISLFVFTLISSVSADAQCPSIEYTDTKGNIVSTTYDKFLNSSNTIYLNQANGTSTEQMTAIVKGQANPVPLFVQYDSNGTVSFVTTDTGTPLTRKTLTDIFGTQYANIKCPAKITDLQTLFLRLLVIINTMVGLVILFVIVKASLIRMTSRGNPEALKKAMGMISNGIVGFVIVLIAYIAVVFIGTRLLPAGDCQEFSFVDSGKILFFFDQSGISPNKIQDSQDSNCTAR
ncbi:MAG: pilin [bacterium]